MERKEEGNFQTQGHPKIPEKRVRYPIEYEAENYDKK